jgi:hypothetical protein
VLAKKQNARVYKEEHRDASCKPSRDKPSTQRRMWRKKAFVQGLLGPLVTIDCPNFRLTLLL